MEEKTAESPTKIWHHPSLLSDAAIEDGCKSGLIVIEPFNRGNLGPNSYDVRLGEWFYREQHPGVRNPVYNPLNQTSVENTWGHPERAVPYARAKDTIPGLMGSDLGGITDEDLLIILAPGETILAHTDEFIGGRLGPEGHGVTSIMHARSSAGRSMLCVCKGAGFGDVGYVNRWTMEITSFSRHHYIVLKVGARIAQMSFHYVEHVAKPYGGQYQESLDLRNLMESWNPVQMLPRWKP